jgi:hypothetical protein
VRLASDDLRGDFSYCLVHPQGKAGLPARQHFKAWLRAAL